MSDFRTKINLPSFPFSIHHKHQILSIGSCFAENIGQRLTDLKFQSNLNPFGILYNPVSIATNLKRLLDNKPFLENELFENHGLWHSFAHHSQFSKTDKRATLADIQQQFDQAKTDLKKTNRLIITLGTAHVFEYEKTGEVVANCHKLPGKDFKRRRLTIEEIKEVFLPLLKKVKSQNADLQIIITISPIRHIRDGLLENQKSKAILQLAMAQICEELYFVHYFPAYEIMMDDLRDYRFYEADMIHPNQVAIDYIWNHFQTAFFEDNTKNLNIKIKKIITASEHRPFQPNSPTHQDFLKQQLQKIKTLEKESPYLNFEKEKKTFTQFEN